MALETDARIAIDRLLREAGWDIEDKAQVTTEEAAADGRADYLVKDSRSRPLAVIEAKRFAVDPYSAKDQARAYAQSFPVHFVLLSNGHDHYLWDYADGDARPILGMPTQADLERRANLKLHRPGNLVQSVAAVPYPEHFRFKGEDITARPYQLECLRAADAALTAGRRRMLFEMATGTNARRKRMHPSAFWAYEFPLPSVETQVRLQGIKRRVDELRQRHREQRRELEALMPSVRAKAFAGVL
jgi:type I restriction enzyme, R subunit